MLPENPFAPPNATVRDANDRRPGSIIRGVLIGGAVDIGGTVLLTIVLYIVYVNVNPSPPDINADGEDFVRAATSFSTIWGLLSLVGGLSLSLLGGYVCAGISRERWRVAGIILAAAIAVFGAMSSGDYFSIGENLALAFLSAVVVFTGSWLRAARKT